MAKNSGAAPLPRRVPGDERGPGIRQTRPSAPPVLSEQDLQRMRAALDAAGNEASPSEDTATAERPASLPRRVRDAGNGPKPPAHLVRQKLPASLLALQLRGGSNGAISGRPGPRAGRGDRRGRRQPDTAARPGPALAVPAGSKLLPAQRPRAEQQPDRQDRDEEMASPEKAPAHQENGQAWPGKAQPRRAEALARPPKPAPPPRQKTSRPPRLAHRSRSITGGLVLMLVVFSAGSLAYTLTRHAGSPRPACWHSESQG